MNERQYGSKYLRDFKKAHPEAHVERISDSPVSRKPYDGFIFMDGVFQVIEFKMEGEKLLPHQEQSLREVKANGGVAKVVYFGKKGAVHEVLL